MRVVFDTSVLVRLTASRRNLLTLKAAVRQGLVLIVSDYLMEELERVLNKRFGLTKQRAKVSTKAIRKISILVIPVSITSISRDSTDDPVVAAAVAGKAEFLATNDKDLLELKTVRSIQIITFSQFLQKLEKYLP